MSTNINQSFNLTGQTPAEMRAEAQGRQEAESRKASAQQLEERAARRLIGDLGTAAQRTMLDDPGSNCELFN